MALGTIRAKTPILVLVGLCLILGSIAANYAGLFAKASRERAQLQQQVGVLQDTLSEKEAEISTLTEQIEALEAEKKVLEEELKTYEATKTLLEAEKELLKAQIEGLESDVERLQAEVLELRSAVDITLVAVSFSRTEDTSSLLQYWIDRANKTVYVMVMLITQDELAAALIDAYERGVEVKVIIDGYVVVTGSYNWSWSAEESNDENVLILKSSVIAQAYLDEFYRIWEGTVRVTREEEVVTLHVVINEVEQNPAGTDYGYEWVELYNPTDQPVDIGGWTLSTTHGVTVTLVIPEGTIIYPGEYLVYSYAGQWLDNEDESVILRDALGIIVDETPLLNDPYNDDWAWSRHPNGVDTDSVLDWVFQPSTMGYANP